MGEPQVVTTADRPDLDAEAAAAFRGGWPEFVFHDPVAAAYIGRVEQYFPGFDVLLLDGGRVVAGGWGVPLRWDGSVGDLPDGYDGALVRAVEGHESDELPHCLSIMATGCATTSAARDSPVGCSRHCATGPRRQG